MDENTCMLCRRRDSMTLDLGDVPEDDNTHSVGFRVFQFTEIKVGPEGPVSKVICISCFKKVQICLDFKFACQESYETLKKQFELLGKKKKSKSKSIKIKLADANTQKMLTLTDQCMKCILCVCREAADVKTERDVETCLICAAAYSEYTDNKKHIKLKSHHEAKLKQKKKEEEEEERKKTEMKKSKEWERLYVCPICKKTTTYAKGHQLHMQNIKCDGKPRVEGRKCKNPTKWVDNGLGIQQIQDADTSTNNNDVIESTPPPVLNVEGSTNDPTTCQSPLPPTLTKEVQSPLKKNCTITHKTETQVTEDKHLTLETKEDIMKLDKETFCFIEVDDKACQTLDTMETESLTNSMVDGESQTETNSDIGDTAKVEEKVKITENNIKKNDDIKNQPESKTSEPTTTGKSSKNEENNADNRRSCERSNKSKFNNKDATEASAKKPRLSASEERKKRQKEIDMYYEAKNKKREEERSKNIPPLLDSSETYCKFCNREFPNTHAYESHMLAKHQSPDRPGTIKCRYCGKSIQKTRYEIQEHNRLFHFGTRSNSSSRDRESNFTSYSLESTRQGQYILDTFFNNRERGYRY